MNFEKTLRVLNAGKLARRLNWGQEAWLVQIDGVGHSLRDWSPYAQAFKYLKKQTTFVTIHTHLDFFDGLAFHVGWKPTPDDLEAEDWAMIEGDGTTKFPRLWRLDENGNGVPVIKDREGKLVTLEPDERNHD
jgi:Protein of unknown function (DUF2829)